MVEAAFIRRLSDLRSGDLSIAGGKATNLGELLAAGFTVPDGFVLTTEAYRQAAEAAKVDPASGSKAAARLRKAPVPSVVADAVLAAYHAQGGGPVAVRSSATAEDLPGASFAGQQDSFLGVDGDDAVVDAVRRCWASLWNERAVAYRRDQGIDDRAVQLAVVVQRMVDARAAGVLFTADPITGRRGRAVIDAAAGLGDAVVSGSVDPDHYAVDPVTDAIEADVRGARPVLTTEQVRELAATGRRIEAALGAPQDIEFAFDAADRLWILQARPITTLFPIPEDAGSTGELRVYLSASVAQGYFEPITVMGMEPFLRIGRTLAGAFAHGRRGDDVRSPVAVSGGRIWADLTPVVRDRVGREILERVSAVGEARSSVVFARLIEDPRFAPRPGSSRLGTLRRVLPVLIRSRIPLRVLRLLRSPEQARARILREAQRATELRLPPDASAGARLDLVDELLDTRPGYLFPRLLSLVAAGMISYLAVGRLLGRRASQEELQTLTRGLPHNPTTEMDLALWALTETIRSDVAARTAFERSLPELAQAYHDHALPPVLQEGLAAFLARYGFRSVGEIDLGVPRWSEDATHLLGALANYLRLPADAVPPDEQFRRASREAEAVMATLLGRTHGPRRMLLRFFLRRARALMGSRELPKATLIGRLFTPIRELLRPVGEELVAAGRLTVWDDIYFVTLAEAREAVAGADLRATVAERRATHLRDRARRHIPRVLLSDGTDAEAALIRPADGALRGSPASPGVVTGSARVIRSPHGARLEPGEILVAPSTDPGWTPLFLTAGGLVMEMGGMMSHGAVVAREYGIPAVVGVAGASERIRTGMTITVDGSAGVISGEDL